jgi:hypothetical protein
LKNCRISDLKILPFNNSTIQQLNNSTTQQLNNSTTQQLNNSTTQQLNNSTTQQLNNFIIQPFLPMKNLLITACLLTTAGAFCQTNECPELQFTYDASGNRTTRTLIMVPCTKAAPLPERGVAAAANQELQVNAYPNPLHYQLTLEVEPSQAGQESATQVTIYDMSGKELRHYQGNEDKIQMDVSDLRAGTFYLNVVRGNKKKSFSMMKY